MVKVVVVMPLEVLELGLAKKYVPLRAACPRAPATVIRVLLLSAHALMLGLGQSPGLRTPTGDCIVTVAVVPEFTIETKRGIVGSYSAVPNVLQYDLAAPTEWPKKR